MSWLKGQFIHCLFAHIAHVLQNSTGIWVVCLVFLYSQAEVACSCVLDPRLRVVSVGAVFLWVHLPQCFNHTHLFSLLLWFIYVVGHPLTCCRLVSERCLAFMWS